MDFEGPLGHFVKKALGEALRFNAPSLAYMSRRNAPSRTAVTQNCIATARRNAVMLRMVLGLASLQSTSQAVAAFLLFSH